MWAQLIAAGFLLGDYIYHRWFDHPDYPKREPRNLELPTNEAGGPVPLIYGRVRIRNPVLVWSRARNIVINNYLMNQHFVLGIPFANGDSTSRVLGMWIGDRKAIWTDPLGQTGDGGPEATIVGDAGRIETLNGKPTQIVCEDGGTIAGAHTWLGRNMLEVTGEGGIPSYRGFLSVFLFEIGAGSGWSINVSEALSGYSFEAYSYKDNAPYPAQAISAIVGQDSNPMNVLYDLLVAKLGKLGLDASFIDGVSFGAAATTLYNEGHGYSRCIDNADEANRHIMEILEQIDAALYEEPSTGKIGIKLIRNDYDPTTIPEINKDNCDDIQNFAIGGWTGIPNKVRLVWTNREEDYSDDSTESQNPANAVGQDGIVREQVIEMRGCCDKFLAARLVARELAARSRPLIKCRAIVDRSFLRVSQGDAVKVTWTGPDISGLVFRVANVERGTLEDGKIALDLIQDYFYVWRNQPPAHVGLGALSDLPFESLDP